MINEIFTGKEKIEDFIPELDYNFSYNINPEFWYRRHKNNRYDTYPLAFFNYFYSLETLEKIGGNGVWLVSEQLSHLREFTWDKILKKKYFKSKPVSNGAFCGDDLLEAGISEDILKDDRMKIFRFDGGWGIQTKKSIFAVVGIVYKDEFYPVWWDPFHYLFGE